MPKPKKTNFQDELVNFLYINIAIFVLLLSFFNLSSKPKKNVQVLGTQTETPYNVATDGDNSFWINFVEKHPTYRDGWIELGRFDKVKEIDPNYLKN